MTESDFEAGRIKFQQLQGPCKGDWCKVKVGSLHRIAVVDESSIKLALSSGHFSLHPDGEVSYDGGLGRTIQRSSLEDRPLEKREPGLFNRVQWVNCRVFKEK